jgi:ABC-type transport system involved in multi-copper enzyme maturation permease subunit
MTTLEGTAQTPRSPRVSFRLERAELLKLRKSRGVWIPTAILTVGVIAIMYTAVELFHVSNSTKYGPAGGTINFGHAIMLMGQIAGMIAAALVGAAAGTQDLSSGVFRDLVSTGRSRTRLFLARIPGGLALLLPLMAAAYALAAVLSVVLAGGLATPSVTLFIKAGLYVLFSAGIVYVIALGLGSLVGSRAATISILIAYLIPIQAILRSISVLGRARDGLLSVAVERISPLPPPDRHDIINMSLATSLIVLAFWVAIFGGLGLWRTRTRDA